MALTFVDQRWNFLAALQGSLYPVAYDSYLTVFAGKIHAL
jgi:hypothetical protein